MPNKKPTVVIGISALNEEMTIKQLLDSLINQIEEKFIIKRIVIASDGSKDKTVVIAKNIIDKRVKVFEFRKRLGKSLRMNKFMEESKEDVFVALDADIKIEDPYFISKLVHPILVDDADLVSADLISLTGKNFFENALVQGLLIKRQIKYFWNHGNNYLSCHGTARAFSKRMYRKFRCVQNVGDDAYSYFWAMQNGHSYKFAKDAIVYIRQPSTFKDHLKQSIRFQQNKEILQSSFSADTNLNNLNVPFTIICLSLFRAIPIIILHPILTLAYGLIVLRTRFLYMNKLIAMNETWGVSSSKAL